jgi:hypothetical protein
MRWKRFREYVRRMTGSDQSDRVARSLIAKFGAAEARIVAQLPDGRFMLTLRTISVPVSPALADELRKTPAPK